MLLIYKDRIEHAATRLLSQVQVNPEAGVKAYDEYVKIRYPYLETAKKREKDATIDQMLAEIRKGPLVINPMSDPAKTVKHKKVTRTEVPPELRDISSRLLAKIGRTIPT